MFLKTCEVHLYSMGVVTGPYWCAKGVLTTATTTCMLNPIMINVGSLVRETQDNAASGVIDPVEDLFNDKVYLFSGTEDRTVYPGKKEKRW